MSKYNVSQYANSSLGGGFLPLVHGYATSQKVYEWGDIDDFDERVRAISSQAGNFNFEVSNAILTLAGAINGVLIRFAEYIPTFPPVVGAAEVSEKESTVKKSKVSFEDFFNKYAKDKVRVTNNGNSISKEESDKMVEEFKKMCGVAIKNGNSQLVKYFLQYIDGIDIDIGDRSLVRGSNKNKGDARYNLESNHLEFYKKPSEMKYSVAMFLHEATHFVNTATRSSYSQSFLDQCYKNLESKIAEIGTCIASYEDCSSFGGIAEKSAYRREYIFQDPDRIAGNKKFKDDNIGKATKTLVFSNSPISDDGFRTELYAVLDQHGRNLPVSKEDKLLYNVIVHIRNEILSYKRQSDYLRNRAISDESFQQGVEDFIAVGKNTQKERQGFSSDYSDSELREMVDGNIKRDIISRIRYILNEFQEKTAYVASAVDSSVAKEICGDPEIQWFDEQLARLNEIITPIARIVTKDAKARLDSMGIECFSPKIIPPYKGRVFDPAKENSLLTSAFLDNKPDSNMKPKSSSDRLLGSRDGMEL